MIKESIFDPIQKELSKDVWNNNQLIPAIKTQIINTFSNFLNKHNLKQVIKSMNVLGSITGYQYTPTSDIDVNVVLDLPEESLKELYKDLPNNILATNTKHPINYYISTIWKPEWSKESNGVYNILKNDWQKLPEQPKTNPDNNLKLVSEISRFFTTGLDSTISEFFRDLDFYQTTNNTEYKKQKFQELKEDYISIQLAQHILHQFRGEAFQNNPFPITINITSANESINNMIYKYIEKLGYQDTINRISGIAKELNLSAS
jgi:hypothetical protein